MILRNADNYMLFITYLFKILSPSLWRRCINLATISFFSLKVIECMMYGRTTARPYFTDDALIEAIMPLQKANGVPSHRHSNTI